MQASYEKTEEGYILKLDELTLRIPFIYNPDEFTQIHITDVIMDQLVYKYNNECLQFTFNGKPITPNEIHEICEGNISFKDLNLTIKEGEIK